MSGVEAREKVGIIGGPDVLGHVPNLWIIVIIERMSWTIKVVKAMSLVLCMSCAQLHMHPIIHHTLLTHIHVSIGPTNLQTCINTFDSGRRIKVTFPLRCGDQTLISPWWYHF